MLPATCSSCSAATVPLSCRQRFRTSSRAFLLPLIHPTAEKRSSRKLRSCKSKERSPILLEVLNLFRSCLRMRCRACCNLDLLFFGYSANRPVSAREDNGCNDQGERSENACLAYPQRCPSTCTHSYWIERTLNDAVPGSVQRDRWPD